MIKKTIAISIIDPVGGHGGMDYYDYGLAKGIGFNECQVLYFTCVETKKRNYKNVLQISSFGKLWQSKNLAIKTIRFFKGYLKSFLLSKKNKSDVFHFHFFNLGLLNFFILLIATLFKQKKVVTLHDVESFHTSSLSFISKSALRFIDAIIFHNEFSKNEFLAEHKFTKPMAVIPHGNYLPFVNSKPLILNGEKIKLLFFGQLKKVKGVDVLLQAMQKVSSITPNFHLTIAGRPWKTEKDEFYKLINDYGIEDFVTTHFRYIDDTEIDQLYADSHIVVMPYKKIYQSGVLLLSMSYGRSVIVSDLDPFTEVIEDKFNGFVFKSENADDLAKCILNLDVKKIKSVTENLDGFIQKNYDWDKIGIMTLKLYNKL